MQRVIICGGAGFIGHHLARKLFKNNFYTIAIDIKHPDFCPPETFCNEFHIHDCKEGISKFLQKGDIVYQFAAEMGGAGYIFTGDNDANIMSNSALININVLNSCKNVARKIFFSSSACVYPKEIQNSLDNSKLSENCAYPANPDSEYGWEKLFSERLYLSYNKNYNLDISIARFHNVYGHECCFKGGKEKAVLALCRKILESDNEIEIWGNGNQIRSFLFIDDCTDAIIKLINSNVNEPVNIGSEESISINELAFKIAKICKKEIVIKNIEGPVGVLNRNSDNTIVKQKINWSPSYNLNEGLKKTIFWLKKELGV